MYTQIMSNTHGGGEMKWLYNFNDDQIPKIEEVGGKARALIELTQGGFKVPHGVVLSVSYFSAWTDILTSLPAFRDHTHVPDNFNVLASLLKKTAHQLTFSNKQKSVVDKFLKKHGDNQLFAIRSSSPEEDLSGASFAGGYETVLGVKKDNIWEAIKQAFISCMDERVFYYKYQNGFDTSLLRIAVIIQLQISSESSGVGFSLNPLNNCFDEIVINANSGLGESVVSGMVTPDEFIVDKYSGAIIENQIGSKKQAVILDKVQGTRIVEGLGAQASITEQQVKELTALITKVEAFYGFPVDIEWSFSEGELYLLQSRPITTFIPLPQEMQTAPEDKRILYLDGSLTKQGISTPISVLGCDCIGKTQSVMLKNLMGKDVTQDIKGGMATTRGGRMYVNLSSSIRLQGKQKIANTYRASDIATAELIEALDLRAYIPDKLPDAMKGVVWGAIKNNIGTVNYVLRALKNPVAYQGWYQPYEEKFDKYLRHIMLEELALKDVPERIFKAYIDLLDKMLPMTYAAELSRSKIKKLLINEFADGQQKMQYLERSLPDNDTIDMGLRMYDLSQLNEIKDYDYPAFKHLLDNKLVSADFTRQWDTFMDLYGCRTTKELDVATPRPYENIEEAFEKIKGMSTIEVSFSPHAIFENSKKQREKTYEEVMQALSGRKRKKLMKAYLVLITLGGKREALKYWYIRSIDAVRQIIIKKAQQLVEDGKLAGVNDVFWLSIEQVDDALHLSAKQVHEIIAIQKSYYRLLERVTQFPKLIDSRGKIITFPKAKAKEGELVGQPISPGVVQGRVKVLSRPDEKPLLPGEIMVTRATDPGWTPLFINASAILLEVGGLLQHGALVAREYGKPCVAGIENVMTLLQDGQLVEVDGARGLIKMIETNDKN